MAKDYNIPSQLYQNALDYHKYPVPGKIQVSSTKPVANGRDLSLAYSPGVAAPCLEIARDPLTSYDYTARGNLVGVISNGTAVLGLGNIGALASKPVMEGKGILFKKFAGIDVFDIEVNETDVDKFVDIVAALEPTFGGINLEDIKAPECFMIEEKLKSRMKIPVFHDDQHGTAIVVSSAIINGLIIVNKQINQVKIVVSGAGAAAIACLDLLVSLGANKKNIFVCDSKGVINHHRQDKLDITKQRYLQVTNDMTIDDAMNNADMFIGLSGPDTVNASMIEHMACDPLVFALANPTPEIMPEIVQQVRPDAIIATGRSDYPNQVNNALCFPYMFRGALDVGATTINQEMKIAAVKAIAALAHAEPSEIVAHAYGNEDLTFGRGYLIPKPLDPRLIIEIAPAVAQAAMDSGIATKPIQDFVAYREKLENFMYKSNMFMRPIFMAAKNKPKRVVLCEGEDVRTLRATQEIVDSGLARLILIGRPSVIDNRIKKLGLKIEIGRDFEVINNEQDSRFNEYWSLYYDLRKRHGITEEMAKKIVISNATAIGSLLLVKGSADAMICGLVGNFRHHYQQISEIVGFDNPDNLAAAVNAVVLPQGSLFIADTFVNHNPTAEELAKITQMASSTMCRFGIEPRVALTSHSTFGSDCQSPTSIKMRKTLEILHRESPELMVDGEMQADAALMPELRAQWINDSTLKGRANLLIMPTVEAANISYNLMRVSSEEGVTVGPILMGIKKPAHIISQISSVRRIVNMVSLACVEAQ